MSTLRKPRGLRSWSSGPSFTPCCTAPWRGSNVRPGWQRLRCCEMSLMGKVIDGQYSHDPVQVDDPVDVDLWNTAQFVWSVRPWVLAGFIAGSLAGGAVVMLAPKIYQATAMVHVVPRGKAVSGLAEPVTTRHVVGIAMASITQAKLRRDLESAGVVRAADRPGTLAAADDPELSFVALSVESDSPARAQAVANTWAAAVVREAEGSRLFTAPPDATVVLAEYAKAS